MNSDQRKPIARMAACLRQPREVARDSPSDSAARGNQRPQGRVGVGRDDRRGSRYQLAISMQRAPSARVLRTPAEEAAAPPRSRYGP